MSRFFVSGDTDSDSSSESSDEGIRPTRPAPIRRTQFVFSEDEEEEKRKVRSLKDKRYDELKDIIRMLKNSQKIRDVAKVQTAFDNLQKSYVKSKAVVAQEGSVPKFYIKSLTELEDFVQKLWEDREMRQKLSKLNAKALTSLKQNVRKYNKDFESMITHCRENPDDYEEEEEEAEEKDEDEVSEDDVPPKAVPAVPTKDVAEESDSDDSFWSESETDTSSESDVGTRGAVPGEYPYTLSYFLKKSTSEATTAKPKKVAAEPEAGEDGVDQEGQKRSKDKKTQNAEKGWKVVQRRAGTGDVTDKDKKILLWSKEDVEVDAKMVKKKRDELVLARGKKGTDRKEQTRILQFLFDVATAAKLDVGVGIELRLYVDLVEATFDNPNYAVTPMRDDMWTSCIGYFEKALNMLEENPDIVLSESVTDEMENYIDPSAALMMHGSILGLVEKLDDEFTKILQATDAHSTEYVDKLKGERKVTELIDRIKVYLEGDRKGPSRDDDLCRIYILKIEHLYYKVDRPAPPVAQSSNKKATASNMEREAQVTCEQQMGETVEDTSNQGTPTDDASDTPSRQGTDEEATEKGKDSLEILAKEGKEKEDVGKEKEDVGKEKEDLVEEEKEDVGKVMADLTRFIYNYPGYDLGPIKTRAILCHIYYLAINDKWFQARDLMLMSHLQEGIQFADVPTQILYNRALVQLGMCAFRHGMIKDAHSALADVHSPPRPKDSKELAKELLAQGLNPRHERTAEQDKIERRRQVPFHMHINLELMECVYLTSAMLLEIPYMAATETEGRRRMISKGFYHQLKNHEKQPLVGPPETMREHVVAAANAMREGNWKKCRDALLDIKVWNLFVNVEQVKEMLVEKIQEETLRTYIFSFGSVYDTLSLKRLAVMFELPLPLVHSIVSRMIIKEELLASLDEPTHSIVMHHAKPNKLQSQALLLAEKIGSVADHNEELMKVKQGPSAPWNVMGGGGHMGHQQQQAGGHSHFRGQQQSGGQFRGQQQSSGGQSHFNRPGWGGARRRPVQAR